MLSLSFLIILGKGLFDAKGTEKYPLKSILEMRKNPKVYFDICYAGGRRVTPNQYQDWSKTAVKGKFCLKAFMTVSNEAFLLLVLENNHARWMKQFPNDLEMKKIKNDWPSGKERDKQVKAFNDKHDIPTPLYTHKGMTGRNKGWTEAGLKCYMQLKRLVITDRNQNGNDFNKYICRHFQLIQEQAPEEGNQNHEMENPENEEVDMDYDDDEEMEMIPRTAV